MGQVNGSGKNWDTHNGDDDKMSSAEFDNFWNKEVVKNQKYKEGKMTTEEQTLIMTKKSAYLGSDGHISKTEFDALVNDCNIALDYKTGTLTPVTPSYTFDPHNPLADLDILDIKDGGADDDLIDKETAIIAYIDAFKAQNLGGNVTDAEINHIKETAKTMLENGKTIDWSELYSIITLLDRSKTKDITKDPYAFDTWADFDYLDAQDGKEDDIISGSNLDNYIDSFKAQNPQVTDTEVTYIKTLAKDLMKDGKIEDYAELNIIILLGNAKRTDITIGENQGTRAFANTYTTPVDDSIKGELGQISNAAYSLATAEGNYSLTKDQAEAHLKAYWNDDKNVSEQERDKILNLLDDMYSKDTKRAIYDVFYPLLTMMEQAKKGKGEFVEKAGTGSNTYTFDFREGSAEFKADFEALDTYKGAGDNDKIGIAAITNYINQYVKKKGLDSGQKQTLMRAANERLKGDKYIDLSEFKQIARKMEAMG